MPLQGWKAIWRGLAPSLVEIYPFKSRFEGVYICAYYSGDSPLQIATSRAEIDPFKAIW